MENSPPFFLFPLNSGRSFYENLKGLKSLIEIKSKNGRVPISHLRDPLPVQVSLMLTRLFVYVIFIFKYNKLSFMNTFFEVFSWLAMIALIATSIPQIILNYKRKSTIGVSWPMFGLLLFGMMILFIRSMFTGADLIIRLNYGLGAFVVLIANLQFFYYRILKTKKP